MPYLIETWDKPDHLNVRMENRAEHLAFLDENKALLLACGAKLADDGTDGGGSFYSGDLETRDEAEKFRARDPFSKVGLPAKVVITRWRKAFFDGKSFLK